MAEYLIKETTLIGIADAIRGKTGGSDPILVADMAEQIDGITGGAGSAEGVHYVTFMSQDGTTELYKRVVADGDDCAEPVSRGLISAPTKESTVQYDYSFVGWTTTPNGAWDENALKAVTEDKTAYAAYASALRQYTITYYDSDGTTVLNTQRLEYGSTPSYSASKEGYFFSGWTPELTPVTGDTSYIAVFTETLDFATATWADISAVSEAGEATKHFSVGDTKPVKYTKADGTTADIEVVILGFNHDSLSKGSGKAGITLGCFSDIIPQSVYGKGTGTSMPYCGSTIDTFLNTTIKLAFPSDLQSVLKKTKREIDYIVHQLANSSSQQTAYADERELFLISTGEVGLHTTTDGNFKPLGSRYEYFDTRDYINLFADAWYRNHKCSTSYSYQPIFGTTKTIFTPYVEGNTTVSTVKKVHFSFCV